MALGTFLLAFSLAYYANTSPGTDSSREIFKVVDQMPLFPGKDCGDVWQYAKRKQCADRAMLDYVYQHIRYPKKARDLGIEGMAVIRFVVEPHGAITNVSIVRDPGAGTGEAAAKVIRDMQNTSMRWEPGLHKGKPVRVSFHLPVKFKLK